MPTQPQVMARIRAQLNEGTARFFPDDTVIGWYSDGAVQQHRIAVEMARQAQLLQHVTHPYLKKYAKIKHINVVSGTSFYAMPTDFLARIEVSFTDVGGLNERDAKDTTGEDWFAKNLPHLRATYQRPTYRFRMDPSTGLPAIELSLFSNDTPNAPGVLRLYYLRDITRIQTYEAAANAIAVDVDDPYNEGPIWYAVAQGSMKRGTDPSGYLAMFERCAQNIVGPMAASSAVAARAQGEGSAQGVKSGESRDGM